MAKTRRQARESASKTGATAMPEPERHGSPHAQAAPTDQRLGGVGTRALLADPGLTASLYVAWAWAMATLGGVLLLAGRGILPGDVRLSLPRAIFHAVSASTLTGYTANLGIEEFESTGRWVLTGLSAVGVWCALTLGGLAGRKLATVNRTEEMRVGSVLLWATGLLAAAVGVGTVSGGGGVYGMVGALGAAGGSGVHLGLPGAAYVVGVYGPLFWLGGAGVPAVREVARWAVSGGRRRVSLFTRLTVVGWAAALVTLTTMYWLATGGDDVRRAMELAVVTSGWGLPIEYAAAWPRPMQVVAMLASGAGVGLGGTTAGLGLPTLLGAAVLTWRGVRSAERRSRAEASESGAAGAEPWLWATGLLAAAWAMLALATWLLLLMTEPQLGSDRLLMLAVGAASASAVSHDPISLVGGGLLTLSGSMALSRVVPLLGLWGMVLLQEGRRDPERADLPTRDDAAGT